MTLIPTFSCAFIVKVRFFSTVGAVGAYLRLALWAEIFPCAGQSGGGFLSLDDSRGASDGRLA